MAHRPTIGAGAAAGESPVDAASQTSAVEHFKEVGSRVRNWGRWGERDQRGTLNFITPDRIAAAGRLIMTGKTFNLGIPLGETSLAVLGAGRRIDPIHIMSCLPGELQLTDGADFAEDIIIMPLQCGTHWDALAHCFYDGLMYNGYPASAVTSSGCARQLGIDSIGIGVVGRGVLLDVAALKGVDCLPPGFVVPCADLEAAETRQGVRVERGDILLVRTGWRRKVSRPLSRRTAVAAESDPRRLVLLPEAGLSQDCAVWLYEREVAAVAADTYAVEVIPAEDPAATLPVHCLVIRDMGMMLGELFDLEALAADCASDGRWDFFFAAPPLKVPNGLGSPINPIAVK